MLSEQIVEWFAVRVNIVGRKDITRDQDDHDKQLNKILMLTAFGWSVASVDDLSASVSASASASTFISTSALVLVVFCVSVYSIDLRVHPKV